MNKQKYFIPVIIVLVLGFVFYWFSLRPTQIKQSCWNRVEKIKNGELKSDKFNSDEFRATQGIQESINNLYNNCLIEKGL